MWQFVTAALGNESGLTDNKQQCQRIQIWQADPRLRSVPPGDAARPQDLGASPVSTAIELWGLEKVVKPSLFICKMRGFDSKSGVPQGLPEQQDKWSSEEDGYKEST